FRQDLSKALLSREWLVKVDNEKSVPYLMKFHASLADQSCVFVITDTKTVWTEVLSRAQISLRWSKLNPGSASFSSTSSAEDEWLDQVLQYLSDVHTLGAISDLAFEVVESRYSDFASDLRGEDFKWRWETFTMGPRLSSEFLSKHLIIPLISTAHLAFTSADSIGEVSDSDLEKAIDKVGRTARRSIDTHIKNAIMRPRVSTTLCRLTALFDFSTNLPSVKNEATKPELKLPSPGSSATTELPELYHRTRADAPTSSRVNSTNASKLSSPKPLVPHISDSNPKEDLPAADGSITEPDSDDVPPPPPPRSARSKARTSSPSPDKQPEALVQASPVPQRSNTSAPRSAAASRATSKIPQSDSDSPPRPKKKVKPAISSSDDESDGGLKRSAAGKRGTRQPIKRGGRRF
ncbi:hypothetical protein BV25DRAFT_1775557, partial [Artomyces pyxidatus]